MTEIDKSTIEGVLTYELDPNDDIYAVYSKQIRCLKEAAYLFDKVLDNHKSSMEEFREALRFQGQASDHNVVNVTGILNELLARIQVLENKINGDKITH